MALRARERPNGASVRAAEFCIGDMELSGAREAARLGAAMARISSASLSEMRVLLKVKIICNKFVAR